MNGVSESVRARLAAARAPSLETARRWRAGAEHRALLAAFAACPTQDPAPAADRAERLFADAGWAGALLAPLVEALAGDPFFEPPFRLSRDAVRTGAVLFDHAAVSISGSMIDGPAMPRPATIVFPGRVTVTRYVRAGHATLRRWRADPPGPGFSAATAPPCRALPPLAPKDGEVHRYDGRAEAQLLGDAGATIVLLVATIHRGAAPLIREHRIADGALVRVASADEAASRTEMLLAFLRRSGRTDAGERFAAASRDPAFHTRWAAMREWLGLDARAALPRLAEMAVADPNEEVRAAAAQTLPLVRARVACPA